MFCNGRAAQGAFVAPGSISDTKQYRMPPVIIEELDDDLTPEQHLDHLLRFHDGDAKKLLSATFSHLKRKTSFFDDPDASKVLARLLRDTKGAAAKPAQPATPAQSTLNVGPIKATS